MVIELLDFTRIEAGKLSIMREEISPLALVESAIDDVLVSHAGAVFSVAAEAAPDATVPVDPGRLRLVLRNLMENAVRYGKAPFRVRIEPDRAGIEIHVEDSGPGVPANEREAVFERFNRGSTSEGHSQGAGIGLYISRGVVELHGGTLTVGQSPLGGADFVVRLPAGTA
jgi:signal transduction histidine kinase